MSRYLYVLIFSLTIQTGLCQMASVATAVVATDTSGVAHTRSTSHVWIKALVAPVLLTGVGLVARTDNDVFSDEEIKHWRDDHYPSFRTHIDDYLNLVPIAAVYGLNAVGVKGKNNFGNRTALIIKTEVIMTAITLSLKHITAVERPDNSNRESFPSGHTAQAFAAATFFAKEYGDKSIWYSVGAYSLATSVGALRVLNNKHWTSDVFVGAGVGILSTEIAYLTHQYKWGPHKKNVVLLPSYNGASGGLYFCYTFN